MSYQYPNSKVAPGYDNSVGLVAWESIRPTGDIPFIAPVVFGSFLLGQEHTTTIGTFYYGGYPSAKPFFGYVTENQAYYVYHTILGDNWSGPATVEFRVINPSVYSIYNTILKIEQLPNQQRKGRAWGQFKISYNRLRFIS